MIELLGGGAGPTAEMYLTMASLLVLCFLIGTAAVVAGVGGGVMFVPLASALFTIHVDFIRGAGLMVALVGAIAAAPALMEKRLSRIRISIPLALAGSVGSVIGARVGLLVPEDSIMLALAILMLAVAGQTAYQGWRDHRGRRGETRPAPSDDAAPSEPPGYHDHLPTKGLSARIVRSWNLRGSYLDPGTGKKVTWQARRIVPAMVLFIGVGMIGGALGVGAGWANVPVLASLMGLPLKMAAATSGMIIVANSGAAAWVYFRQGALDPLIVLPAVAGMIAGTRVGAKLLGHARPETVRLLVITVLVLAGARTLWGVLV
ncbi:MAG: sulfite exporter TauE/SafE family protein [Alkalispirochaeta sp.]